MQTYLLSIKQKPFEALVDGRKKHEFRRRFSKIENDFQVVFYVSSPIKAIAGVGIFKKPIFDTTERIIELVKKHKYSSPENLAAYFYNINTGYALPLKRIKKINKIKLDEIRQINLKFMPPQSYFRLMPTKHKKLLARIDLYDTPDEFE